MKKRIIALIGSSGSIGTQTKDVVRRHPELFCIGALVVNSNLESLYKDIAEFRPQAVGVSDETAAKNFDKTKLLGAQLYIGSIAAEGIAAIDCCDTVMLSVSGMIGLKALLAAIETNKRVCLANKESLVCGGEIVMRRAKELGVIIYPVDSEHSAIFQCLHAAGIGIQDGSLGSDLQTDALDEMELFRCGKDVNAFSVDKNRNVERIVLTASGGPFRGEKLTDLQEITPALALKHPTWNMGAKITIDSSTLMNKGLEILEARWLFDTKKIDVILQPTSIIHSMVEFVDGGVIAQLGTPSMELPIQLALTYPKRVDIATPRIDFETLCNIPFEKADEDTFDCLKIAKECMNAGGYYPTVMNAADEVAVELFLQERIKYLDIQRIIRDCVEHYDLGEDVTVEGIMELDREVRRFVMGKI